MKVIQYIIVYLAFSSFAYTGCHAYSYASHYPNKQASFQQYPIQKKSEMTLGYCIMKAVKYIVSYFAFTGIIYLLIYIFLHDSYKSTPTRFIDLIIQRNWTSRGRLRLAIQELENKMPLFCFYWPVAIKHLYLFINDVLESQPD